MKSKVSPVNRILRALRRMDSTPEMVVESCEPFLTARDVRAKLWWMAKRGWIEWDLRDGSDIQIVWRPEVRAALERADAQFAEDAALAITAEERHRGRCPRCGQRISGERL
jgi:hypothetical protein